MRTNLGSFVHANAGMIAQARTDPGIRIVSHHRLECFAYNGGPRLWCVEADNLVTTQGLNDLLDKYFKGSTYTATWFVGLVDNAGFTTYAAGDTAAQITTDASGANQWGEVTEYDEGTRPALTLGTPAGGSVDNSASKAVFTMNSSLTVRGAFIVSSSTKAGTAGVLYCEVDFSAAQPVISGNVLNETTTLSVTSA